MSAARPSRAHPYCSRPPRTGITVPRARPFGHELEQRSLDERHVAREHEHRTDGAQRVDPRDERGERSRARRGLRARPGARSRRYRLRSPDRTPRPAHGAARAASVSPRNSIVALSAPIRRLAPPVSRSAGNRFTSFTSVRIEYSTTSQPVARFSSITRFCTRPSAEATLVATTAVCRSRRHRRRRLRRRCASSSPPCAARFAAMNSVAVHTVADLVTGEIEQQVEVELVPCVLVRDRDIGRPGPGFEPERDPHHDQQTRR